MRILPFFLTACLAMAACMPASAQSKAKVYTDGTVLRWSENKNKHGRMQPPWTKVEVTNIGMKRRPNKGELVTVVPFALKIQPLTLKVTGTKKGTKCIDSEPDWWEVKLEPVTRKDFYAASPVAKDRAQEYPFDVAVLYPAARTARFVARASVKRGDVPKRFGRHNIVAGVDLTGNRQPDILYLKYCTKAYERQKPYWRCEGYTSSATYARRRGRWRKIDSSGPC